MMSMPNGVSAASDGPTTPGHRACCQTERSKPSYLPVSGALEELSPQHASDRQLGSQEGWWKEAHFMGDGRTCDIQSWFSHQLQKLGPSWPVPVAAVASILVFICLGYTWARARPGVQTILLTSLLQFCWAIMSSQGPRRFLRLAQLTSAFLGILVILPKRDVYGTRIWAAAFDEDDGVILPGFATSLAKLFGLMDTKSKETGDNGYVLVEDADLARALLHLEVSLAAMVMIWMLQTVAASCQYATRGPTASAVVGGSTALNSAKQLACKSHVDLPALEIQAPCCEAKLRTDARTHNLIEVGREVGIHSIYVAPICGLSSTGHPDHCDAELQQQRSKASVVATFVQRTLFMGACLVQCVVAIIIIGSWDALAARLDAIAEGGPGSRELENLVPSADSRGASWVSLEVLCIAMSAPLALPSLLRSRLLLHTAIQLRPAVSRSLGLLLLDVNAAKLLLSTSVGVLGGWMSGALAWQLSQVATMLFGIMKLCLDGFQAQGPLVYNIPMGGSAITAPEAPAKLMLVVPEGPGYEDAHLGFMSIPECPSTRTLSPRFTDLIGRVAGGLQDRGLSLRANIDVSPAVLATSNCGDGGCAMTLASGGASNSANTMRSPYSSGDSLVSVADAEQQDQLVTGSTGATCTTPGTMTPHLARRPALANGSHSPHCQQQHLNMPSVPAACTGNSARPPLSSRRLHNAVSGRSCGRGSGALLSWDLLLGSFSLLTCMLWVALFTPPIALLGDEAVEFFEGLMDTGVGAIATLIMFASIATLSMVSGTCLVWFVASGELRQRRRLHSVEGRRWECLAWASGLPLAVAAFSALSWALGDDRNTVAYLAAEILRCTSLWPLMWFQEPWLIGGVDAVGGCVQHAGCGVTCCILRWCGLRPSYSGVLPRGRCDERGKEPGQQVVRFAFRRARWPVAVDVN
ncbi:hypothetical protein Vretimale_12600 [Volvox reticuliferus]|uniref:Uncharacterized protein n=1 Tax=Volvox reticuliferus TaxID=1737510 RepID=A0A8J4BWC1_9CHLO|nr:hypothetical protein Vretifemale_230 [Volvox reticuliferus]GIM08577.1 hypothetical protein Vretimale_12600 [Volvox reticuliferus]